MIDILKEYNKTGWLLDKTTQSLSSLPYDFDEVKIKANQYVTANNFNDYLHKLYYNLLYIYRACNVASFSVFDSFYYNIASYNNTTYTSCIVNKDKPYAQYQNSSYNLANSFAGVLLPYNKEKNNCYLFFVTDKTISSVKTNYSYTPLINSSDKVDPLSGDIKYKEITDLKTDYYENLYVVDRGYNIIYQYGIANFISQENIYKEQLFVKNAIGGLGTQQENSKFNGIKNLAIGNNLVVAQDVKNQSFKLFDKNLNWINTSIFSKVFFKVGEFTDIVLDKDDNLYCCVGKLIYKFIFNNNRYDFENFYDISPYCTLDENIIHIYKIPSQEDLFYILTNKSVKKVWNTTLNYVVGEIKADSPLKYKWLGVSKYNEELDIVALYGHSSVNGENLSINLDKTYYNSLLNNFTFEVYSQDEVYVESEEYVQSWTIMKNLNKMYTNCLLLLQNIKYKFFEKEGIEYPVIDKKIYNTGFLSFVNSLTLNDDLNIGTNEIFQSEVINRCIKQIYDLQVIILLYIVKNQNNKIYYSPDPSKNEPSVKKYTYYVDESLTLSPNPIKLNIFGELAPGGGLLTSLGGAPFTGIEGILVQEGVNI
jgi:hypothetical protein